MAVRTSLGSPAVSSCLRLTTHSERFHARAHGMTARNSNFDALRLCAASAVVFSHSFLLAEGTEDNEPLQRLTGEISGMFGVFVFFVLSGYLISQSCVRLKSTRRFLWNRALRILPGYIACALFTTLLLCPAFCGQDAFEFLTARATWRGLLRCLMFRDDVLLVQNFWFYGPRDPWAIGSIINGVLWTLRVEVALYLVVAVLYQLRALTLVTTGLLCLGSSVVFIWDLHGRYFPWQLAYGAPAFLAGSFLYFVFQRHKPRATIACALLAACALATFLGVIHKMFPLLAAYPILFLGDERAPRLGDWASAADLSFGIYLLGWPVQQALRALTGPSWSGWAFAALSLPVTASLAWVSWRCIEKPALQLRDVSRGHLIGRLRGAAWR